MTSISKFAAISPELGSSDPESLFGNEPVEEITIERLFNAWMAADGEAEGYYPANPALAAELRRHLHDALKADYTLRGHY
jgi:hypothetical protein